MACGMCGPTRKQPYVYKVTFDDGTETRFLTNTEARMYAMQNGGGVIEKVDNVEKDK